MKIEVIDSVAQMKHMMTKTKKTMSMSASALEGMVGGLAEDTEEEEGGERM